jgi:hypothetical protein
MLNATLAQSFSPNLARYGRQVCRQHDVAQLMLGNKFVGQLREGRQTCRPSRAEI